MNLITISDIYTITGMDNDVLASLIPYAEAQAEAMLGFLKKETKTYEDYVYEDTYIIQLPLKPVNEVSSITYQTSATSDGQSITDFRVVKEKGLVISDTKIPEDSTFTVTYSIGWDQSDVPNLVKMLLVILVVDHYFSLYPDTTNSSQIVISEKIGDYAVKYANLEKTSFRTFQDWANYLGELILNGSNLGNIA